MNNDEHRKNRQAEIKTELASCRKRESRIYHAEKAGSIFAEYVECAEMTGDISGEFIEGLLHGKLDGFAIGFDKGFSDGWLAAEKALTAAK